MEFNSGGRLHLHVQYQIPDGLYAMHALAISLHTTNLGCGHVFGLLIHIKAVYVP